MDAQRLRKLHALALKHVLQGERLIAQQRKLLASLDPAGSHSARVRDTLETMETTQAIFVGHLSDIEQRMAEALREPKS